MKLIKNKSIITKIKTKSIMKKLLLLSTIAMFGITKSINAQNVDVGLKTGLNISNVTGGDADRNSLFDFHIGGLAEFGRGGCCWHWPFPHGTPIYGGPIFSDDGGATSPL